MQKRGRPRTVGANLPNGVHCVKSGKKTYYYYQSNRSSKDAGARVALGSDPLDPAFWSKLRHLIDVGTQQSDTFSALIAAYKGSPDWRRLRPDSKTTYERHFRGLSRVFGDILVADITRRQILEMRDAIADTLPTANSALKVMSMIMSWAVLNEWRPDNPVKGVPKLKQEMDTGHKPWPEDVYAYVMANAPDTIKRMAYLGRATGQRVSDLIRICPSMLADDGIYTRISKLRDKRHFVPLMAHQMAEIRSWIDATLSPDEPLLRSRTNKALQKSNLQSWFADWMAKHEFMHGKEITIHGLKVTAVCDRFGRITEGEIAKEIGMSLAMVMRYTRFIDAEKTARASRDSREAEFKKSGRGGGVVAFSRKAGQI